MRFRTPSLLVIRASWILALVALGCTPKDGPQVGSQTSWLKLCEDSEDCGDLSCICGTCTLSCDENDSCEKLPGATCINSAGAAAVAICDGQISEEPGICLVDCATDGCGPGNECLAGVCTPQLPASTMVSIDTKIQFQKLDGFGASLALAEDSIIAHPLKSELYDAMFRDSGLDVLRLLNRYDANEDQTFAPIGEILAAAQDRMAEPPTTLMTSASPPASLKENDSRSCRGAAETCTLKRQEDGSFEYDKFAEHWVASLGAYGDAGIFPDFISIQNNPNWTPPSDTPNQACKFLPMEGTQIVSVNGEDLEFSYPGYVEALEAVSTALNSAELMVKFTAPEVTSAEVLADYSAFFEPTLVDSLSYHMYNLESEGVNRDSLQSLNSVREEFGKPLFQSEMQADGFDTAVLIQSAFTLAGASMYLQNRFVGLEETEDVLEFSLISINDDSFSLEEPFHTMRHFARKTAPGWVRVDAASNEESILASAFIAPNEDALTVVLVNNGEADHNIEIALDGIDPNDFNQSEVHRTTFDGSERYANLGSLSSNSTVRVPTRAILTVALFN